MRRAARIQAKPKQPATSVNVAGRPIAIPAVVFKRHRNPTSIVKAFLGGDLRNGGLEGVDADGKTTRIDGRGIVAHLRGEQMWAWADATGTVPTIHFWHQPDADRLQLAAVLGHEVGHLSGKKLRSRRNDWREELRADEYGAAAYLALRQVLKR